MAIQATRTSKSGKTVLELEFAQDNGIVIGLSTVRNYTPQYMYNYMYRRAGEVERFMKNNHPWRNRTGRAERGLHTEVYHDEGGGNSITQIGLYHDEGTWYWRHLEYGMGRRFAIIEPTMRYYGPRLLNELDLSSLFFSSGNPVR